MSIFKQPLRQWPFTRVLFVCIGWIGLSLILLALWTVSLFWSAGTGAGSGGIGAVSIGISELVLAIPVGPPIVLFVAWLIVRARG